MHHTRSDSPHGGHLRLLRSDSPHGGHLRHLRSDSPHGGHLRLLRSDSPPRGHPHLSEWDSLRTQGLAPPGDPFLGILALQGHAPPGIPSLQREVPLLLNEDVTSREIQSLLSSITHLELRLGSLLKRMGHSRSSPTHPSYPSREEKEADETSVPATVKAMVDFIMKVFLKPRPLRPIPHLDHLICRPR